MEIKEPELAKSLIITSKKPFKFPEEKKPPFIVIHNEPRKPSGKLETFEWLKPKEEPRVTEQPRTFTRSGTAKSLKEKIRLKPVKVLLAVKEKATIIPIVTRISKARRNVTTKLKDTLTIKQIQTTKQTQTIKQLFNVRKVQSQPAPQLFKVTQDTSTKQLTARIQRSEQLFKTRTRTMPKITPTTFNIVTIKETKLPPLMGRKKPVTANRKLGKAIELKRNYKYTPDITAYFKNIKGRKPKRLTGIEVRPLSKMLKIRR